MRQFVHALSSSKITFVAVFLTVLFVVSSVGASLLLSSDDLNAADYDRVLEGPSWQGGNGGLLGTDRLGRSMFFRILAGLQTSYLVGLIAIVIGASVGIGIGLTAGYLGGRIDALLMRLTDVQLAFPALLMAMVVIGSIGGGALTVSVVLGLNSWMLYARVIRSIVLSMRQTDFIQALEAIGARPRRIMWSHLLPNSLGPLVAVGTIELARVMLAEASLSFVGLGVKAPAISLGAIMAEGRDYVVTQWWVTGFAGGALALAVLSLNITGSWLQRYLDPVDIALEDVAS